MKSFFEDEFLYSKVLSRLTKDIKEEQLDRAIEELEVLNNMRKKTMAKSDFTTLEKGKMELIKKTNNAKRTNLQI